MKVFHFFSNKFSKSLTIRFFLSALDFELCEMIRIVGSAQLIAKLENQYQEDEKFRRRWSKTQFIFLPAYWHVDGDDDHWYSMGIQTNLNSVMRDELLPYLIVLEIWIRGLRVIAYSGEPSISSHGSQLHFLS